MNSQKQSPLFTRCYDLLRWLIPATVKFPRQHRFVLAAKIQETAFALHRALLEAVHGVDEREALRLADARLAELRLHLRLAHDLRLFSTRQYKYASGYTDEIGRLLGGWIRKRNGG